jgi:glycosyltransferase involved in cell wall biosynthesis
MNPNPEALLKRDMPARPLTVLQLGMTYAPMWKDGGPPRIMYDYAQHLIAAGFRVMVLTSDSNRPKPEDQWGGFPPGLEVHYCRKLGGWPSRYYLDYSWNELTSFFDRHWRELDFIHLYQTRSMFNIAALWAARKYGLRIVLSSFGSMPRRGSISKYFYDQLFVIPLARSAELLLAQTHNECEVYRKYGGRPDHIHLLPLAVDTVKRPPLLPGMRTAFREKFSISQSAWLFLFVGRLHTTKGVEFLVNSYAEVAKLKPEVHLAIIGHDDGSRDGVIRAIKAHGLETRVTLCGPLFDTKRWQAYVSADCFTITPEIYEETSLASLEALSCGTPVITNRRADVPWLEEYAAGWVVPEGDMQATAAAMLQACECSPVLWSRRRQAADALIREKFEIGAVTRQFAVLLRAAERTGEKALIGPLLIGPLPGSIETSGQAVCFKLLVDGLKDRRMDGPVVDLGSSDAVSPKGKPTIRRAVEYISIFYKMVRNCWRGKQDVYLTIAQSRHGFFRDAVIIVLARLLGNEVTLHLHGGNYANYYRSEPWLLQGTIRLTLRRAHRIIVLADSLRSCFDFDPELARRLRVVQNSFPAVDVPAASSARQVDTKRGPRLLYLSNLIESKGYLEVLEVLAYLREREGLDAQAVFCGIFLSSPSADIKARDVAHAQSFFEERALELKVAEHVSYRGSVSGLNKERVLQESDFLVFPTRYDNEGQPVVLIEALAYGLPAVTTDYRANGEMVIDGVTGFLMDWRDTAGMARKIAALWRDPAAYEKISGQCRTHFEQRFTPKAHIDAMQRILFNQEI